MRQIRTHFRRRLQEIVVVSQIDKSGLSRRRFVKGTVAAGAVAATGFAVPAPARVGGSNDRIRIGFIGPGRRGFSAHVRNLVALREAGQNIDLVAVCEVYSSRREKVADFIARETAVKPKRYGSHEGLLADGGVDAVCIATPDHWHARQTSRPANTSIARSR